MRLALKLNLVRNLVTSRPLERSAKVNLYGLNFDRRIKVDYKESLKYLDSETYKKVYGNKFVWQLYKRNFKSITPSENSRPNCVGKDGFLMTSHPCPICRDEFLVLHPENVKLLKQFIDPYTGEILSRKKHGVCLRQYRNLVISIIHAKDTGLLTFELPDRLYDYKDYYDHKLCSQHN